jgi:hypothetical protein
MGWLSNVLHGTAVVADEECNVLLGPERGLPDAGNPHATISARLGEMRARGSKFACVACRLLTWIARRVFGSTNEDHCAAALKASGG